MAATLGDFAIATFAPEATRLLGEGLWSRVYDLGDGTVLKIAREACAGIGSGRAKIEAEHTALVLLSQSATPSELVPRPCGHGAIPVSSALATEGFAVWLRSTKLTGRRLSTDDIKELPPGEQAAVGRALGSALARLHAALTEALSTGALPIPESGHDSYAEIFQVAQEIGDSLYLDAIEALRRSRSRIPRAILDRPAHCDFNISNLLFSPDGNVSGIVDFAEWGREFPEKDLSDIVNELPGLTSPLVAAYETHAGFSPDPHRLTLGIAENALYSAVIGERLRDVEQVKAARELLTSQLRTLTTG